MILVTQFEKLRIKGITICCQKFEIFNFQFLEKESFTIKKDKEEHSKELSKHLDPVLLEVVSHSIFYADMNFML